MLAGIRSMDWELLRPEGESAWSPPWITECANILPSLLPVAQLRNLRIYFIKKFQMSGGLAPSKTTIYVSNIPFSLTNNDLHKIFEKYGKVVKVTIMRDPHTRKSKGVAFVLFLDRDSTYNAVRALNNTQMFGRTIKCSVAKDNGRAADFIRRKIYKDKSKCYECGEEGHLSYKCPKNLLGEREPPPKKQKKGKGDEDSDLEEENEGAEDSLSAAIRFQQQKMNEDYQARLAGSSYDRYLVEDEPKRKKYKKDAYFSDEEELADD